MTGNDIAVIGLACRLPGARDWRELWQNLCGGVESITSFADEELLRKGVNAALLRDSNYVKAGGVVSDAEAFDAAFFDYLPREAEMMDPQQRIFLECCWHALEDAGYDSENTDLLISVFGGVTINTFQWERFDRNKQLVATMGDLQAMIANDKDFVTSRVAYKLNLKGPSFGVQTACSTSLVAVYVAWQMLLSGACDIALAGGSSIRFPHAQGYLTNPGGTASADGHCRAFDAGASGSVVGSGAGVVVLKRLADAVRDGDTIHAVIKGAGMNNDGRDKVGFTAPSVSGHARSLAEAIAMARVSADSLGYVEAHGTGTRVGDPIEFAGLTQGFRETTDRSGFCALGSIKTNIGHLDAAAGIAGFIKTVLCLKHRTLVPSLNFESPNPAIDFASSPFYVNTECRPWRNDDGPLRAAVCSTGMGGANAHVVLEEPPAVPSPSPIQRPCQLFTVAARAATVADRMEQELREYVGGATAAELADVAYTSHVGRRAFPHRRAFLCEDPALTDRSVVPLAAPDFGGDSAAVEPSVVFMFPGQGAQYPGMTAGLLETEPAYRETVNECAAAFEHHTGTDLMPLLRANAADEPGAAERLAQTPVAQASLFAVEYGMARLLMSWGIRPDAMIGHSVGECVAACIAGVLTLEDAIELVVRRGEHMEATPAGAMLSVRAPLEDLRSMQTEQLVVAALNGPQDGVLAGSEDAIGVVERQLRGDGVACARLSTARAFHSPLMDSALDDFVDVVRHLRFRAPTIPYVSNVTGDWLSDDEACDVRYWARHIRQPVRFADGVALLLRDPGRVLVEVGPGRTLTGLVTRGAERLPAAIAMARSPKEDGCDSRTLMTAVGQLWCSGVAVDWSAFHASERRRRVPLPTYAFERTDFSAESVTPTAPVPSGAPGPCASPVGPVRAGREATVSVDELAAAFRRAIADIGVERLVVETDGGSGRVVPPVAPEREVSAPAASGADAAEVDDIEGHVRSLLREFGVDAADSEHDLVALGVDSMMLTQLLVRLRQTLRVDISTQEIAMQPTITRIVELAGARRIASAPVSMHELLDEIEGLSDAEVEARIAATESPVVVSRPTSAPPSSDSSDIEKQIGAEVALLIGREAPGRDENLIVFGMDSLMLTQVLTRLRSAFGADVSMQDVIDNPTIAGLAALVRRNG